MYSFLGFFVVLLACTQAKIPTVPEIIRRNGYPCEIHHVTTGDGYILTLHRIPHGKRSDFDESFGNKILSPRNHGFQKPPVIMQHGLLSSSGSWTLDLPQPVPAFIMADAGYDVWLTNVRGSFYSRNHTRLSPDSKEFWKFSWDEMARYDFPAFIDYVLETSNKKQLFYVGHSMGTTIFFSGLNYHPEYNDKVLAMFGLAPVATVGSIRSPVKYFARFSKAFQKSMERLGYFRFLPRDSRLMSWARFFCDILDIEDFMCENFLFIIVGFDGAEINRTWIPVIEEQLISGTSLYTVMHYAQGCLSGNFSMFDFGVIENLSRYGQNWPPLYDLKKVTTSVNIFWAKNDYLADQEDVSLLIKNLPNVNFNQAVPNKKFNHLDFLFAKDAKKLVYDPMLQLMEKYLKKMNSSNLKSFYAN